MTDPPCAGCGHAALCHRTNYGDGPCWYMARCRCPGYLVRLPEPPALPPAEKA